MWRTRRWREEKVRGLLNPTEENRVAPANWLRIQKSTVKSAAMSSKVGWESVLISSHAVTAPAQICLRCELRCNHMCSVGFFPLFILCKDGATIHSRWRVRQWNYYFRVHFSFTWWITAVAPATFPLSLTVLAAGSHSWWDQKNWHISQTWDMSHLRGMLRRKKKTG